AVGLAGLEGLQARHRALHGAEVGQRAAQPALGHVRHAAALGLFLDRLARAALGADEQDHAALLGDARDEVHRVLEQRDGLLEVDDVDLAAGAEDVRGHLRVPVAGLVAEVDAGFQHLAHGDLGHCLTPGCGTGPRPSLRQDAGAAARGRGGGSGVGPPWRFRVRTCLLAAGTPARAVASGVYSPGREGSGTLRPAWAAPDGADRAGGV